MSAFPNSALGVVQAYLAKTDVSSTQLSLISALAILSNALLNLQYFLVNYTFTSQDQSNGYAFVSCQLPKAYADANYNIQCTLQSNNTQGGYLVLGYVGGDGSTHGSAPTPAGFSVVLLGINSTGIVAGQTVTIFCNVSHL